MTNMFHTTKYFNQDVSEWDTSRVTTLHATFANAEAFNQNLFVWNVSRVSSMRATFQNTKAFKKVLCWDASKVDTTIMFYLQEGGSVNPNC